MIGLITTAREWPVAEEFFQLFKTPWERFDPDHTYEVILSSGEVPAPCECSLLIICTSGPTQWDADNSVTFRRTLRNGFIELFGQRLPIYGQIATHAGSQGRLGSVAHAHEAPGCELAQPRRKEVRLGYDLFDEVAHLLTRGQPPENASFPTLDLHIEILRRTMLEAGLPVLEIPPVPEGANFISCLTHDIDFYSLRQHRFDRAMWGFFYRATVGTWLDCLQGRCSLSKVSKNAAAALKWPLVQLGLSDDFWVPFGRYLEAEQGRPSTFFLIPFKDRCGKAPAGGNSKRRAVRYDLEDMRPWVPQLKDRSCEIAVHGLDAWRDASLGREELARLTSLTAEAGAGVRMHWLYFSDESPRLLEEAGFDYDSTCGYNNAVGYRAGTTQVFRPLNAARLLELPLHMQDTAMFFPGRMHLKEADAWNRFTGLLDHTRAHGGVLTVLWHERSLVPERLWDRFYSDVLRELSAARAWFGTARDVVAWFRQRRALHFQSVQAAGDTLRVTLNEPPETHPGLVLRITVPGDEPTRFEVPLKGRTEVTIPCPGTRPPRQQRLQVAG